MRAQMTAKSVKKTAGPQSADTTVKPTKIGKPKMKQMKRPVLMCPEQTPDLDADRKKFEQASNETHLNSSRCRELDNALRTVAEVADELAATSHDPACWCPMCRQGDTNIAVEVVTAGMACRAFRRYLGLV